MLATLVSFDIVFAQPAGATSTAPTVHPLRQILITDTVEAAQQLSPDPAGGFVVLSPTLPYLEKSDLSKRLASGEGVTIDDRLLAGIALVIETYARERDFPAATAIIPPQSIAGGVVRVAVSRGKIREIKVEGANWFSESLLREKLRIERGETLRLSELDRAVVWTNSNPYRRLKVHIQPVPETGEADLTIGVVEQRPLRLVASYDNTGNEILGVNRYTAGVNYGNAWGREHQVSYQFITSDDPKIFRAHNGDYRIPLSWRHVLAFSASYAEVNPTFLDDNFTQKGESFTADAKYVIPFAKKRWRGEMSGTVGFKQTNNNLEFGGIPQLGATIEVLTGSLSVAGAREDQRGNWVVSAMLVGSPGKFSSRSTPQIYHESRLGANPQFLFGHFWVQRNTLLAPKVTSMARATAQLASTNLVPTEQLSYGGLATVRGYEERILTGDSGYSFTHELQYRLPSVEITKRWPKIDTAALVFWDYGRIVVKKPLIGQRKSDYLASMGVGIRASISNNFSLAVDFARQLEKVEIPGADHQEVHVRASLSF